MLNAFRRQLRQLSQDPHDPFTQRIRELVGARQAPRYETSLRQMILAVPDMVGQIRSWAEVAGHPWKVRQLHNFVLAYLYNPDDFLPEKSEGFFGYVDDAYLVASVYDRTVEILELRPQDLGAHASALCELAPRWIENCHQILPEMTSRIDGMLDRLQPAAGDVPFRVIEPSAAPLAAAGTKRRKQS